MLTSKKTVMIRTVIFIWLVTATNIKEEGEDLRKDVIEHMKKKWPGFEPTVEIGQIGATIGVHTGPHPIGFGLCERSCSAESLSLQAPSTNF